MSRKAEKLLQRGKTSDALEEYLQVLLEDPENDNVRSMAADLCLSLSRTAEAVSLLGRSFRAANWRGRRNPRQPDLQEACPARQSRPGSRNSASDNCSRIPTRSWRSAPYENALDDLAKQRKKAESLQVLSRIVIARADPGQLPTDGGTVLATG